MTSKLFKLHYIVVAYTFTLYIFVKSHRLIRTIVLVLLNTG